MEIVAEAHRRIQCNIVIKEFDGPRYEDGHGAGAGRVLYRIPNCLVPPGRYSDDSFGKHDLDEARLTLHGAAWSFFDPARKNMDEFEGTDAFQDGEREVIIYVMADVPGEAVEELVTFLAEKFSGEALHGF